MRTRYPAGSGDWQLNEMFRLGGQTYWHPMTAHEDPGTELYIYAEDVYGNSAQSDVQLYAVEPCLTTVYDFVDRADKAQWSSEAGTLPFPGETDDDRGFARWEYDATMEDESQYERVLETHPQWVEDGLILGEYKDTTGMSLQTGDRLTVKVGFLKGGQAGDAVFRVWHAGCRPGPDCADQRKVVEIQDSYDGQLVQRVIALDELVDRSGWFWLEVYAGESAVQDWAAWVEARIERP
jgi:hypothetical protein